MSIVIDKASLVGVSAAAKDFSHPALAGVALRRNKAVTSDGFRMMVVDLPREADIGDDGIVVEAARLPKALSALGVKGTDTATVGRLPDPQLAVVSPANVKQAAGSTTVPVIDLPYPDERLPEPKTEPAATIHVSARYLKEAAAALAAFDPDGEVVRIDVYGPTRVLVLSRRRDDGRQAKALIMPMVLDTDRDPLGDASETAV